MVHRLGARRGDGLGREVEYPVKRLAGKERAMRFSAAPAAAAHVEHVDAALEGADEPGHQGEDRLAERSHHGLVALLRHHPRKR